MSNSFKMMSAALLAGAMVVTSTPADAGRNSGSSKGSASGKANTNNTKGKGKVKASTSRAASPKKRTKNSSKAPKVGSNAQSGYTTSIKGKERLVNAGNVFGGQGRQREATASQTMPSGSNPFASTSGGSNSAQAGPSNRNATATQAFGGSGGNAATNRKAKASDVIGRSNPFASTSGRRDSQPPPGIVNNLLGFFGGGGSGGASVSKGAIDRGNLARKDRGKGDGNS